MYILIEGVMPDEIVFTYKPKRKASIKQTPDSNLKKAKLQGNGKRRFNYRKTIKKNWK